MPAKPHQVVADQLSALFDQAEEGAWDLYENGRDREALQTATALKTYAVRYKVVDTPPPPEVLAALDAAYQSAGDWQPITDALAKLGAPAKARVLTDSGDQSAMPSSSKSAPDPFAAAFQGDLRSDMVPR